MNARDPELAYAYVSRIHGEHAFANLGRAQFLADSNDCYYLTRNSFDGGAINRAFESAIISKPDNVTDAGATGGSLNANGNVDWQENAFTLGIALNHNGDANHTDRMISGLNTNGSKYGPRTCPLWVSARYTLRSYADQSCVFAVSRSAG